MLSSIRSFFTGSANGKNGIGAFMQSAYRGASTRTRQLGTWFTSLLGPNTALDTYSRNEMVSRSHDAYRNQPFAKAAVDRMKNEVIGTGLKPQPNLDIELLEITEEEARKKERQIERLFYFWANSPDECDIERTKNFFQQQELTYLSSKNSGDCFVNTPFRIYKGGVFGQKLQIIEADRVSNPNDTPNTSRLVDGIETGNDGAPMFHHVRCTHPGEMYEIENAYKWEKLRVFGNSGRRRSIHTIDYQRPGQRRGVPMIAIVLKVLKQLDRYADAEELAAILTADPCIIIEKESTASLGHLVPGIPGMEEVAVEAGAKSEEEIRFGPGGILEFDPGEKIKTFDSTRPNSLYEPFVMAKLKEIGAALSIPFEIFLMHFSASFSASRAAFLLFWKFILAERAKFAAHFCQPAYELWMDSIVAQGLIELPGYGDPLKRKAWNSVKWNGPAKGSIKELEAVKAARERIELLLSDHHTEAALIGNDFDVIIERAIDVAKRKREGGLESQRQQKIESVEPGEDNDLE